MISIIDGYNVMHAMEAGAGIGAGELEEKRQSFIESVISHAAFTGEETIIVFDSKAGKSPVSHDIPGTSVTICFASASESADIVIGKLVQEHLAAHKGRIRVVSGDWEVQKGSLQDRVERVHPRHFLAESKNFEKKVAKSSEMDRIRWKLEHKLDAETLRKLEKMRRGQR